MQKINIFLLVSNYLLILVAGIFHRKMKNMNFWCIHKKIVWYNIIAILRQFHITRLQRVMPKSFYLHRQHLLHSRIIFSWKNIVALNFHFNTQYQEDICIMHKSCNVSPCVIVLKIHGKNETRVVESSFYLP